jgi:hypothetical protein
MSLTVAASRLAQRAKAPVLPTPHSTIPRPEWDHQRRAEPKTEMRHHQVPPASMAKTLSVLFANGAGDPLISEGRHVA